MYVLRGYAPHLRTRNRVPERWGVVKVPSTAPQMPHMRTLKVEQSAYAILGWVCSWLCRKSQLQFHLFFCFHVCSKSPIAEKIASTMDATLNFAEICGYFCSCCTAAALLL